MSHELHADRRHDFRAGWLNALEILVLAPLSAILVLGVTPAAFRIEWECSLGYGVLHTVGDEYLAGFSVGGALGWLAVLAGVIFAQISELRAVALLLPLAWFVLLVVASVAVAAAIGPASCPA
jgi:hypothetical protein